MSSSHNLTSPEGSICSINDRAIESPSDRAIESPSQPILAVEINREIVNISLDLRVSPGIGLVLLQHPVSKEAGIHHIFFAIFVFITE